ncbi:MAG: hypothetical protein WC980_06295 [Candidatus Brocadiia bacterium]
MRKISSILFLAFIILICSSSLSYSLTIKLRNGDYLTGDVSKSDEDGFEFKRWDNEGVISIRWYHLPAFEINRMKSMLQIKVMQNVARVTGEKIFTSSNAIYEGVIVAEDDENVYVKNTGGTRKINKKDIRKRDQVQIDLFKVYTYNECYDKMLSEIKIEKAADQFKLAEYCQDTLKMYDKAKEHFLKAGELDIAFRSKVTKKIIEIDMLVIQDAIFQVEKLLEKPPQKNIDQAKEILLNISKQFENSENQDMLKSIESIKNKISGAEKLISDKNLQDAAKKISRQYYTNLKNELRKVSEGKLSYGDATYWVSTNSPKNILSKLSKDNKITEEETSKIIANMSKLEGSSHTANYGEGSWIVASAPKAPSTNDIEKFTEYQDRMKRINDAKSRAANNNELITADTWWNKAVPAQRESWLEAFYAERLLTVLDKKEKPCSNCVGEGIIKSKLCNRCWGTLVEITIIYK